MNVRQLQPSDMPIIIKHALNDITCTIADIASCFDFGSLLCFHLPLSFLYLGISWINISFERRTMLFCLFVCFSFCFVFFRDRFRTTVNVLGDSIVAGVVEHLSRDDLKNFDDYNGVMNEIVPLSNRDESREPDEIAITTGM